jgi:hypothetical protein
MGWLIGMLYFENRRLLSHQHKLKILRSGQMSIEMRWLF